MSYVIAVLLASVWSTVTTYLIMRRNREKMRRQSSEQGNKLDRAVCEQHLSKAALIFGLALERFRFGNEGKYPIRLGGEDLAETFMTLVGELFATTTMMQLKFDVEFTEAVVIFDNQPIGRLNFRVTPESYKLQACSWRLGWQGEVVFSLTSKPPQP